MFETQIIIKHILRLITIEAHLKKKFQEFSAT